MDQKTRLKPRKSNSPMPAHHERELQALFELCPDMLCVVRTDGRFLLVNPAYQQTLGYTLDDLESLVYWDLVHPDAPT